MVKCSAGMSDIFQTLANTDRNLCTYIAYYNKHEVDFYDDAAIVLPVEVKYRERVTSTDARGVVEFMHVFDQSVGILVTTDEFGKDVIGGRDVLCIPIWLFLLVM